jgi:hypothetical protein
MPIFPASAMLRSMNNPQDESIPLDSLSHRVVRQDGGFAVHILTRSGTKVVPGFPTAEKAQEWITREMARRETDRRAEDLSPGLGPSRD